MGVSYESTIAFNSYTKLKDEMQPLWSGAVKD